MQLNAQPTRTNRLDTKLGKFEDRKIETRLSSKSASQGSSNTSASTRRIAAERLYRRSLFHRARKLSKSALTPHEAAGRIANMGLHVGRRAAKNGHGSRVRFDPGEKNLPVTGHFVARRRWCHPHGRSVHSGQLWRCAKGFRMTQLYCTGTRHRVQRRPVVPPSASRHPIPWPISLVLPEPVPCALGFAQDPPPRSTLKFQA